MVLSRILKERLSAQLVTVMSILLGYIPLLVMVSRLIRDGGIPGAEQAWTYAYAFVVYSCLGYSYFHIFNMSETARRIRILYEIYAHPKIALSKMKKSYGPQDMFPVRIERLLKTGQIRVKNGRYVLRMPLLALCASIIARWRKLLGFDASSP
jgi:hypothetical protein